MKKYSYNDWWFGRVTLNSTPVEFEKNDEPKVAEWQDFSDEDMIKIRKRQKEIFNERVSKLINELQQNFLQLHQQSEIKEMLVKDEMNECYRLLFKQKNIGERFISRQWNVTLEYNYLVQIQFYVESKLKNGISDGFAFIHSPKNKYQPEKVPPQIIAQSIWEYFKWLKNAFSLNENDLMATDGKINNPYQQIFINGYAYQMFLELVKIMVKDKTRLSDYGFIFHKMKSKYYNLIHKDTKEKTFIGILNNDFNAKIVAKKFPMRNDETRISIFDNIFDKYKDFF